MASNVGGGVPFWQNMPMPPGWQAKYDQNTRKYFYINHSTRSTQWVDPRKAYYESRGGNLAPAPTMPQHPPRMPQHSPRMPQHPPRMPQQPPRMPMTTGHPIPMQTIAKPTCKTCKRNEVPTANQECQGCQLQARQREAELVRAREAEEAERKRKENQARIDREQERRRVQSASRNRTPMTQPSYSETSFGVEQPEVQELTDEDKRMIIRNLDDAFPGVERSVVEMVLESSSWDADKATSVLRSMAKQKQVAKPKPKPAPEPKPAPQPSESAKKQMREFVKKIFPDASDTLVEMVLETTKYDRGKACAVLRMTIETESKKTTKKSTPTAKTPKVSVSSQPSSTKSDSTPSTATTSVSITPAVPSSVSASQPTRSSTTASSSIVTSSSSTAKSAGTSILSRPRATSPKPKSVKAKAKAQRSRSAERPPQQVISSPYSCQPDGPDRSLVSGPNKDNLISSYMKISGTDRGIVEGPQKENVIGPSQSMGHDVALATGPQGGHYVGPQSNLAKGSLYTAGRQM